MTATAFTRSGARRAAGWAAAVPAGLAIGLALLLVIPPLLGFERYVITGGSMAGTYDRGSIVFARPVPVAHLRVGDVITYKPPPGAGPRGLVTHRIVRIAHDRHGRRVFRTKGDANRTADRWRFTLDDERQARAVFDVPFAGFVPAALGIRAVRLALIGLPALLIGAFALADLWREAGRVRPRREVAA